VKILILGGGGMLGQKIANELARSGGLNRQAITELHLVDAIAKPSTPESAPFTVTGEIQDITAQGVCEKLVATRPDLIFHLAAVVSGEAELNFEKGYLVNLDGTRNLLEAIRLVGDGYRPRLVFTSSVAVYGGPYPEIIEDDFILAPLTSYGTQKAIGELLLSDYSRRGFVDGIGLRLPTICVRPGLPNKAASGLFSNIIREPLVGIEAILPSTKDVKNVFASPRSAVGFALHAASLDTNLLGNRRSLMMPGVTASVGDEIEALRKIAGDKIVALIKEKPDSVVQKMVSSWDWPGFTSARARSLGFKCDANFEEIIKVHIQDELGGEIPGLTSH
jgi:nucleoside-diphosphate-sugar epimerase